MQTPKASIGLTMDYELYKQITKRCEETKQSRLGYILELIKKDLNIITPITKEPSLKELGFDIK